MLKRRITTFIKGLNQSYAPVCNYKVFIEFEDGVRRSEHPVIHHASLDSSFAILIKIFEHHSVSPELIVRCRSILLSIGAPFDISMLHRFIDD